jgi:hypothetical protein
VMAVHLMDRFRLQHTGATTFSVLFNAILDLSPLVWPQIRFAGTRHVHYCCNTTSNSIFKPTGEMVP